MKHKCIVWVGWGCVYLFNISIIHIFLFFFRTIYLLRNNKIVIILLMYVLIFEVLRQTLKNRNWLKWPTSGLVDWKGRNKPVSLTQSCDNLLHKSCHSLYSLFILIEHSACTPYKKVFTPQRENRISIPLDPSGLLKANMKWDFGPPYFN